MCDHGNLCFLAFQSNFKIVVVPRSKKLFSFVSEVSNMEIEGFYFFCVVYEPISKFL